MYVELVGYGASTKMLLRLKDLPYLQVFKQGEEGGCFVDTDITMPQSSREETLSNYMATKLWESKGDPTHYLSTIMRYYQQQTKIASSQVRKLQVSNPNNLDNEVDIEKECTEILPQKLKSELCQDKLERFAALVDKDYYLAFQDSLDWSEASMCLVSPDLFHNYLKLISE